MKCMICSSALGDFLDLYDDRYGYPGISRLGRCLNCGHTAVISNLDPGEISNLYTHYYPRSTFDIESFSPARASNRFSSWLNGEKKAAYRWVPSKVRVLDIGCGFGESLAYHKARGCDVYGVEADENIGRVAERYGFRVHVGLFNPDVYEPAFFDYITMDQVIEHMTDPVETLKGVAGILRPGGTAIISTPNANSWGAKLFGRSWINWHVPYHRHFFSLKSMTVVAERAGLSLEKARTITSSEWLFYQWIHLGTRPPEGKPSVFWSPHKKRGIGVKTFFAILLALHYTKINHIITRLFDAAGVGDNYLFILKNHDRNDLHPSPRS